MEIDVATGMLCDVRYVPSPNYNERPTDTVIDLLVIHNISLPPGEFGGPHIDAFFTNVLNPSLHPYFAEISGLEVSSHCLIRRDGEIVQYVPFNKRAWHAG
ncbi:MAG TPA: 1,6-anhydro-N-acetylmuramyl-L-alanine amidase AmpD, partial [Gammaproteobacteria bacterium]|nr:1,6-anhydro-N-acetylmuramyl-L-alanine amidase AmpD [Gammaproteobacteria bacterium]